MFYSCPMTCDMQRAVRHSAARHDAHCNVSVGPQQWRALHMICTQEALLSHTSTLKQQEALTSDLHCLNVAQERWKLLLFFLHPGITVLSVPGVSAVQRLRPFASEKGTC